jgi:hypothetical protein
MVQLIVGIVAGIVIVFGVAFATSWYVQSKMRRDFTLEYQRDEIELDNNANVGSLVDMLKQCPRDATITFGINEDGNMTIRIDNVVQYNADLNEVVVFPFDRPTQGGGYKDMLKKQDEFTEEPEEKKADKI